MMTFCQWGLPSEKAVTGLRNSTKLKQIGTSRASTMTALAHRIRPEMMHSGEKLIAVSRPRIKAIKPRITAALLISHLNHQASPSPGAAWFCCW